MKIMFLQEFLWLRCTVRLPAALTGTLLLAVATVVHGQTALDEEFDNQNKAWQEIAVQFPPAPLPENLLPFPVSPTASQSFAIDAKSLTVGADGVIRYTLVAVSPAGAKSISYEGIRCQSTENRLYAVGHADGSWVRAHHDQWEAIDYKRPNRPRAALAEDYFCHTGLIAGDAEQMLERIRNKRRSLQQQSIKRGSD